MNSPQFVDLFYTPIEVMKLLKLGKSTVYELLRTGELPSKKVGHSIRISRDDLEAFIERAASAAR